MFLGFIGYTPGRPLYGFPSIPFFLLPKGLRKSGGYGEYTYTKGVFLGPYVEANFLRGFGRENWNFGMWFIRGRAFTVSGKIATSTNKRNRVIILPL